MRSIKQPDPIQYSPHDAERSPPDSYTNLQICKDLRFPEISCNPDSTSIIFYD